jgi:hypothetical protein
VEMHLPHKISRDTACDLPPVLTLNDESCGNMIGLALTDTHVLPRETLEQKL